MAKPSKADALLAGISGSRRGPRTWFDRLAAEDQALVLELMEKAPARGCSSTQITDALRAQGIVDISAQSWRYFVQRRHAKASG